MIYVSYRRVRIISKVEKVLYSRAFFNISSGAENILKTYFVFGALTKGFHKGKRQINTVLDKEKQDMYYRSVPNEQIVYISCSFTDQ